MLRLDRIIIYPIKSLDGVSINEVQLLSAAGLRWDRQFAMYDERGQWINGKKNPLVHRLRSSFDLDSRTVSMENISRTEKHSFHLDHQRAELQEWLSGFFHQHVELRENCAAGFPDDTDAPGPTIIGSATLAAVASWFPGLDIDEARRRFRANLEIDVPDPFWEDRLVGEAGAVVPFQIGDVRMLGANPCQRCAVPTRSSETGEVSSGFAKEFAARREATLPAWSPRSRFNHYYRLAVNTRVPASEAGKWLRTGDVLRLS
jgi:uncharacterized protein YcbX